MVGYLPGAEGHTVSGRRISRAGLDRLIKRLSERDVDILTRVDAHRFLTTRQLARFCFADKPTATAALRAANRALAKLGTLGLIAPLARRIGGVRAGSGGYVWSLTETGGRILERHARREEPARRQRFIEPSPTFLEHTLAVAEAHLTLRELPTGSSALMRVQLEPECWRSYLGPAGSVLRLKPDMAAVTRSGDFEDHWFFEIDRNTEPPSRVVRKCLQYQEYYRTGTEQHRTGVFPAVVWVVPDQARREQLATRLRAEATIDSRLFTVITLDQLPGLVHDGPAAAVAPDGTDIT